MLLLSKQTNKQTSWSCKGQVKRPNSLILSLSEPPFERDSKSHLLLTLCFKPVDPWGYLEMRKPSVLTQGPWYLVVGLQDLNDDSGMWIVVLDRKHPEKNNNMLNSHGSYWLCNIIRFRVKIPVNKYGRDSVHYKIVSLFLRSMSIVIFHIHIFILCIWVFHSNVCTCATGPEEGVWIPGTGGAGTGPESCERAGSHSTVFWNVLTMMWPERQHCLGVQVTNAWEGQDLVFENWTPLTGRNDQFHIP